jgi:5-methylcytosine-specific restriction enzyme subunit McrC
MPANRPSIVLSEWQSEVVRGIAPTRKDRLALEVLSAGGRVAVLEIPDGIQIQAQGWIGVINLDCCNIRIEPSLIDGHANLIRLLDCVFGLHLFRRLKQQAPFDAQGADLFDLVAWLLVEACDDVLRRGVQADYVERHEDLKTLRGRLDVRKQVLKRWGQVDRLECDYEDRVRDIPENRWLLRALRVARSGARHPLVESTVKRAASTWAELCQDDPGEPLPKPAMTRVNQHYREALELAYLVLGRTSISNVLQGADVSGFSFLLNMPQLFEIFLATAVERVAFGASATVQRQASDGSILWNAEEHHSFGRVRPDLLLRGRDGRTQLPVDAKYKPYDASKLSAEDVYQTAIYGLTMSHGSETRRSVIVYPAGPGRRRQRVQVRLAGSPLCEIEASGILVPALLDELACGARGSESDALRAILKLTTEIPNRAAV